MMPPGFEPAGPSVLIYFTDGTTASLGDGAAGMKGRKLDQIQRIELHPWSGDILGGTRNDGVEVCAMSFKLHELPFQVLAVVPKPEASFIADELKKVATGMVIARAMPTGRL